MRLKKIIFKWQFKRYIMKSIRCRLFEKRCAPVPMRIREQWQLDVMREMSQSTLTDKLKRNGIPFPNDSEVWTDLQLVLMAINKNEVVRYRNDDDEETGITDCELLYGTDGFTIFGRDVMTKLSTFIDMKELDKFKVMKLEDEFQLDKFELSKIEQERKWLFDNVHRNCDRSTSLVFTPTSIGCCVKVRCNCCKEEVDITDVSCW